MRFIWKEPLSWTALLERTSGHRQSVLTILRILREAYDAIEVYHAARPIDVDTYYRQGILLADHVNLTATAHRIFRSGEFPELDEAAFEIAVEQLSGIDNSRIYTGLDDRHLLEHCGHYLIYGSEHVCGIAAALSRNHVRDYRQILKRSGRPTMFRISLPFHMVADSDLLELGALLLEWARRIRAGRRPSKINFTFTLRASLPPSCIIGHEHPEIIKDPLLPMQPFYRYEPPV